MFTKDKKWEDRALTLAAKSAVFWQEKCTVCIKLQLLSDLT
jgi:hypothetical protein